MTDPYARSLSQEETARLVRLLLAAGQGVDITEDDMTSEPNPAVQQIMAAILMLDEDLREKERELAQSERKISVLLDSMGQGVGVCDKTGHILWSNKTATDLYPGIATGKSFEATALPVPITTGIHRVSRAESNRHLTVTFSVTEWGGQQGYLFWIRDTSADANLRRGAINDPLTDLPNRVLFFDRLSAGLRHTESSGTELAILYMDIDQFKQINDVHGHIAGDQVLKIVARRIKSQLRSHDLVARIGGDEFAMVAEAVSEREVDAISERIKQAVAEPVHLDDTVLSLTVSVGVARTSQGRTSAPEEIMDRADKAMFAAKHITRQLSAPDSR